MPATPGTVWNSAGAGTKRFRPTFDDWKELSIAKNLTEDKWGGVDFTLTD